MRQCKITALFLQAAQHCLLVVDSLVLIYLKLRLLIFPLWKIIMWIKPAMKFLTCQVENMLILQCGMMVTNQSSAVVVGIPHIQAALNMQEMSGLTWETFCCMKGDFLVQQNLVMAVTGLLEEDMGMKC